jgi:hypothetical protein
MDEDEEEMVLDADNKQNTRPGGQLENNKIKLLPGIYNMDACLILMK